LSKKGRRRKKRLKKKKARTITKGLPEPFRPYG